jgi:hypothetical protein
MSKLLSIFSFELKPGVTQEEFKKHIREVWKPISSSLDGVKPHFLVNYEEERAGKYAGLLEFDSVEIHDKYFPSTEEGSRTLALPRDWLEASNKLSTLADNTYTDYVEID